jgi:hypothetical protein
MSARLRSAMGTTNLRDVRAVNGEQWAHLTIPGLDSAAVPRRCGAAQAYGIIYEQPAQSTPILHTCRT